MCKCLALLVVLVALADPCFAGSDSLMSYYNKAAMNTAAVLAQQAPFGYIKNIDTTGGWTAPAGIVVQYIYIGKAGFVRVATYTDTATFKCAAGSYLPIMARRIISLGTTADSLVALGKR